MGRGSRRAGGNCFGGARLLTSRGQGVIGKPSGSRGRSPHHAVWSAPAERSGDGAWAVTADRSAENQSGVALRFPPQSKKLALLLSALDNPPVPRIIL